MSVKILLCATGIALCLTVSAAYCANNESQKTAPAGAISEAELAQVIAGQSTKTQIQSLLGAPWRVAQFNDCGDPMPGQADETWEYRGRDASGSYRFHVEFDDKGIAQLVAKIPDQSPDGTGTIAKIGAVDSMMGMQM